jgi:DNA-binding NarL/FixJ family response regulator
VTDLEREQIKQLRAQGWGRRAIASRLRVSERAVRNVLEAD